MARERRKRMENGKSRAEPQYFDGKEYCILCGSITEAAKEKPISEREYYIEGAGQLCRKCYQEIYVPRHSEDKVQLRYQSVERV